jgi:hypothetical protein
MQMEISSKENEKKGFEEEKLVQMKGKGKGKVHTITP